MLSENVRKEIGDIKTKRLLAGLGWLVLALIAGYRSMNDMFIFGKARGVLLADEYCGKLYDAEEKEGNS